MGLLLVQPSFAATTIYTASSDFTSALTASVVDDYSDPGYQFLQDDATMSAVLGETEYMATGFTNNNIVFNGYYCAGCNGSFKLGFTNTSVGTGAGVFGVGLNFYNDDDYFNFGGPLYTAFVTFGDGSTFNYDLPQRFFSEVSGFFGLTSDLLITSIAFGLPDGGTTMVGAFGIDNLTIGSGSSVAPIPLPAGGMLLLTALVGLGWAKRRRA